MREQTWSNDPLQEMKSHVSVENGGDEVEKVKHFEIDDLDDVDVDVMEIYFGNEYACYVCPALDQSPSPKCDVESLETLESHLELLGACVIFLSEIESDRNGLDPHYRFSILVVDAWTTALDHPVLDL